MRRSTLLTILLVFLLVVPVAGAQRDVRPGNVAYTYWSPYPPPKPLRFVDGHWTPYSPPDPATFPAEATAYTIVSGDTLWALANRFYGDNLLWPFLWENNAWITDPHWIYPGDPLMVPPLVLIEQGTLERVEDFQAPDIGEVFMPAGSLSDMYCSFYLTDEPYTDWDMFLIGSDDALKSAHADLDVMYMNKGRADGVAAGDEFTVLTWERNLKHPISREEMGSIIRMIGTVRVLCTQEHSATVMVTDSCDAIEPGHRLRPYEVRPSPMRLIGTDFESHCVEPFPYGRGHIVYVDYDNSLAGSWQRVAIDLGSDHGVLPGDTFLVYRDERNDDLRIEHEMIGNFGLERYNDKRYKMNVVQAETIFEAAFPDPKTFVQRDKNRFIRDIRDFPIPRKRLGELVVLSTEPESSVAVLTYSRREIVAGDKIELKPGQPIK